MVKFLTVAVVGIAAVAAASAAILVKVNRK